MSTAGARHFAESQQWLAARQEKQVATVTRIDQARPAYVSRVSTASLAECAAAHDGVPVKIWIELFRLKMSEGWK